MNADFKHTASIVEEYLRLIDMPKILRNRLKAVLESDSLQEYYSCVEELLLCTPAVDKNAVTLVRFVMHTLSMRLSVSEEEKAVRRDNLWEEQERYVVF